MPIEPKLGDLAVELPLPGGAVATGQLVDHHPADVVAMAGVAAARIAEADDKQIERRGAFAPAPGEAH